MTKYRLECTGCGATIPNFSRWFLAGQRCPQCDSTVIEARYNTNWETFDDLLTARSSESGLWRYFDYLPVESAANVVTAGEGNVTVERWGFLEDYARGHGVDCKVYAHRQDTNPATGTLKDLAGSMVASVLKEAGVDDYVVATTGNVGAAFARYLAAAGINLHAFVPMNASRFHGVDIAILGQKVFRVPGDYADAKRVAADFARSRGLYYSPGGFDPIRIEAKKTIAYELLRGLARPPTVYIQALSGGMGPLGVAKGMSELQRLGLLARSPRFYLVQTDGCAPMAAAWDEAKSGNFASGWENRYPVYDNPVTDIPILSTGNPRLYPLVGRLVRDTGGEIVSFPEQYCVDTARLVAVEVAVAIGPAAAVAVGGFLYAVRAGHIRQDDVVVVVVGEGIRRSPEFALQMAVPAEVVHDIEATGAADRRKYRESVLRAVGAFAFDGRSADRDRGFIDSPPMSATA